MAKKKGVTGRILHDPIEDRLTPIFPLDLVRSMGQTAYTARQIGDAADVLEAMARDKDCFIVMTLSGALTVGKMGLVFCDLVDAGIVKAIVSTGALMAHGLPLQPVSRRRRVIPQWLQPRLRLARARSEPRRRGRSRGSRSGEVESR